MVVGKVRMVSNLLPLGAATLFFFATKHGNSRQHNVIILCQNRKFFVLPTALSSFRTTHFLNESTNIPLMMARKECDSVILGHYNYFYYHIAQIVILRHIPEPDLL